MVGKKGKIDPSNSLTQIDIQEIKLLYNCGEWQYSAIIYLFLKFIVKDTKRNGFLNNDVDQFYSVAKSPSEIDCQTSCESASKCMVSTFLSEFNTCFLYSSRSSEFVLKDFNKSPIKPDLLVTESSVRLTGIFRKHNLLNRFDLL